MFTLIVCTRLTGILLMDILENICPTIINRDKGTIVSIICLVGFLILLELTKFSTIKHQQATNKNWTKVNVTGYLNRFIICFPVLLDKEEERYHMKQHAINLVFSDKFNLLAIVVILGNSLILNFSSLSFNKMAGIFKRNKLIRETIGKFID